MADEDDWPSLLPSSAVDYKEGPVFTSTYRTSLVTIPCQSIAQIRSMGKELIGTWMMIDPFFENISIVFPDKNSSRWNVFC